ncbi:MAG: CorA family divalent cation transporter, partial [Chloroflexota bacterium]
RFTKTDITPQFGDIDDHLNKITETLEEAKENVEIFKDADWVLSSERVNRIIRVLTVLSTVAIPFLIITSFYGMNIVLPGGIETGSTSLKTFFILIAIMTFGSGIMLYIFRRQHWI